MQQNESSLFEVAINEGSKQSLYEIAKWANFLAIVGLIVGVLIAIIGLFIILIGGSFMDLPGGLGALGGVMGVAYMLFGFLYIYPCMKQRKFSKLIVQGITNQDQETIALAFQNLKTVFKFWGILTIVILALYAVLFLAGGAIGAFAG